MDHRCKTQIDYYKKVCEILSIRSTCTHSKVGAILVKNKIIVSTGYNGSPRGAPHCDFIHLLDYNLHCLNTVHAEENCILNAARNGVSIEGCELYSTHKPCFQCMKRLINAGITKIFYWNDYKDNYQDYFSPYLSLEKIDEGDL